MRLRIRPLLIALTVTSVLSPAAATSQVVGRQLSNLYFGGDNVRVLAGRAMPQGGMHNWSPGLVFGLAWESWDAGGGGGAARVAVGLAGSYGTLPFDRSTFISDFESTTGKHVTSANAPDASIADLMVTLRVRGPTMFVMPSLLIGLGYYNFTPRTIAFQAADSTGTARSRSKSGPSGNIGIGLDGPFIGRTALFGEALYAYGWSSDNILSQSASSRCGGNVCDTFKSTQATMIRGGVRVRLGRY